MVLVGGAFGADSYWNFCSTLCIYGILSICIMLMELLNQLLDRLFVAITCIITKSPLTINEVITNLQLC